MNTPTQSWEERFDSEFVRKTYPFLGGQRNYFIQSGREVEMELIKNIKSFIADELRRREEEVREEHKGSCNLVSPHIANFHFDSEGSQAAQL